MRARLTTWLKAADRLCAYDCCRLPMPWFAWSGGEDAVSVLHRRVMEMDRGSPIAAARWWEWAAAAALHAARGGREIALCWRAKSAACRKGFGVSRGRQLATLIYTTFRHNFPPSLYYRARLFRLERKRWASVFSHGEVMVVLREIEARTAGLHLWSKRGWARFCARHGLPLPPLLALVSGGRFTGGEGLEGRDLFIKPDLGWASRGTVLLEWRAEESGWRASGGRADFVRAGELERFVQQAAAVADVVVQPRLRTRADLADLAPRALANLRVVTIRSAAGRCSVFSAGLRIPWHEEHCSDAPEGLFVPLDLATGRLECAEGLDMSPGPLATHPLTGARIEGREIAAWPEMRERALAAHALLPEAPCVGWDLVATEEAGVLILEANVTWSANLAQLRGLAPLGESEWPEAVLAYLDCVS